MRQLLLVFIAILMANTAIKAQSCVGTTVFNVTITPLPAQPSTISGLATPCVGTQAYSVSSVAGVTYTWSATGGTVSGGQGTSNVTVTWSGTGAQTLTCTPSNTCGNGTARTQSITIDTTPAQPSAISGFATPCVGTQAYSVSSVAGVTYTWSATGGTVSSGQGTSNVTVTWSGTGAQTLTCLPSNTCGNGAARTQNITIDTTPAQPSAISGLATPCVGTQAYSVSSVAGVTYTWSATGGTVSSGQGTSNVTVTWSGTGAQTLTCLPSNTCGNGAARTQNITIDTTPSQPSAISGLATPCVGTQAYSVSSVAGVTYTWSATGGTVSSGQGTSNVTVTWSGTGAQTLTCLPSNTCGNGTARTQNITIDTTPAQPSAISGLATPCVGTQAYSVSSVAGVTYTWSATGGTVSSGQGTSNVTVTWSGTGAQTLTCLPSNTCGNGAARSQSITIDTTPAQPSAISGLATPCVGTQAYSVSSVAGVTYTWSATGGTVSGGQGTSNVTVTWSGTGAQTLTCLPSNTCGNGTARTQNITIDTTPAQPSAISGLATPCVGTQAYSVSSVAGVTYTWSATGGTVSSGQGTSNVTVTWSGTGAQTLTCLPSNTCGNGAARTQNITIDAPPAQPSAIVGSSIACTSDAVENYNVTNVNGVTYTWSVSGGGTLNSTANTANIVWTTAGTYLMTVTPANTCGSGTARTLSVEVKQTPNPLVSGNNQICQTLIDTYTVPNTVGNTYLWSVSGNGTIISGQGTNSITVQWNSGTAGTVTITETVP
jgi:hypothetical protein